LWQRLQRIAKSNRPGGKLTLPELIEELRPEFNLKDYPDHQSAWQTLERLSEENRCTVRGVIGPEIRFSFDEQQEEIKNELLKSGAVAVLGESGAGKSSLIATILGQSEEYDRILWFRIGQLAVSSQFDLARSLQLQHDHPALIRQSTAARSVLIVDGFDQFNFTFAV
jgi:ABC-type transport system involved in cytochrome bd biosynthesis fused ATPase/permease subunit